MLYFEPGKGMYVRDVYKTVPFDPLPQTPDEWKKGYDAKMAGTAPQRGGRGARGPAPTPTLSADTPIWIAIQGCSGGPSNNR